MAWITISRITRASASIAVLVEEEQMEVESKCNNSNSYIDKIIHYICNYILFYYFYILYLLHTISTNGCIR